MPMLHILGIDNCNNSFTVALCFIRAENEVNYSWSLQELKTSLDGATPKVCVTEKEQALMNVSSIDCYFFKIWTL